MLNVEENYDAIMERSGAEIERLCGRVLDKVMESQAPKVRKVVRLREIGHQIAALIGPNTPCKRGCSHCCHIAVAVTKTEADLIGEYTGRVPAILPARSGQEMIDNINAGIKSYLGVPCVFLGVEGECTIYPVRPIPCILHHTVAPDSTCCDTTKGVQRVPALDVHSVSIAMGFVCQDEPIADLREFFPS